MKKSFKEFMNEQTVPNIVGTAGQNPNNVVGTAGMNPDGFPNRISKEELQRRRLMLQTNWRRRITQKRNMIN